MSSERSKDAVSGSFRFSQVSFLPSVFSFVTSDVRR